MNLHHIWRALQHRVVYVDTETQNGTRIHLHVEVWGVLVVLALVALVVIL